MNYTKNAIYDYVVTKILAEYPNIYHASTYQPILEEIPAVFIKEIYTYEPKAGITLDFQSEQYKSTFEVQVASKSLSEAEDIMRIAKSAFKKLYFRASYTNEVPNKDTNIKRMVGRFERIICGGDVMPED